MNMRKIIGLAAVAVLALSTTACERAMANKQTLKTNNCGVSWELIPAGQTIASPIGMCSYYVTIPDYPMQGEANFKTSFKNRVLATVSISYDYQITDGKAFISEAKYIGKMNSSAEDESNASGAYETAENVVIDKRLREIVGNLLRDQDIVEFDAGEFEDKLLADINDQLKPRGVKLNTLAFVPTPQPHTAEAIDIVTSLRVYQAAGVEEEGKRIVVARAGAPSISTTVSTPKGIVEEK